MSTTASGAQAGGSASFEGIGNIVSADGRYVVFSSGANNLVTGDTNNYSDIFLKDTQTGAISRVSTSSTATQGNGDSSHASISADGRYVLFRSDASNLVPSDTNNFPDYFIKDTQTGTLTRVSTSSTGVEANDGGWLGALSAGGRYVAFTSDSSNIVVGDTNGTNDVFLKDTQTGTVIRVSTSSSGAEANAGSAYQDVSADGRYVVFQSDASNLVAGDTNNEVDIFVKDTQTGAISRISLNSAGGESDSYSYQPKISPDGHYITFESGAALTAGDTNGTTSVYRVSNPLYAAACFTRGTLISTPNGERPVETLAIGDTILLSNGDSTVVKWIGRRTIPLAQALQNGSSPVLVCAGALGEDMPSRDLYVSPDHALLFDGTLIHASAMVNGDNIRQCTAWPGDVEYFHIETEQHAIILANGAPAETFIDNQARQRFDNAAEYDALYPNASPMRELRLPRVKFHRQLSAITAARLHRYAARTVARAA